MKLYILSLAILRLYHCKREDEPKNEIFGTWKLKKSYTNGKENNLAECRLKSTLEIPDQFSATFTNYYTEDNECKSYIDAGKLYKESETSYIYDPPSLMDQRQRITITQNTLIFSWDSWEFVNGNLVSTPVWEIYNR